MARVDPRRRSVSRTVPAWGIDGLGGATSVVAGTSSGLRPRNRTIPRVLRALLTDLWIRDARMDGSWTAELPRRGPVMGYAPR